MHWDIDVMFEVGKEMSTWKYLVQHVGMVCFKLHVMTP